MFLTFEGIEGCGKSTQAKRLVARLTELKIPVIHTIEPGGTGIGQDIRGILLDNSNECLAPLAELFLYAADRAQHMTEVIKPALLNGTWVVSDRFFDATVAYQGYGRNQDISLIKMLNSRACSDITPDKTFLIDCPVEIGLERAFRRNRELKQEGKARFEREKVAFHESVRKGYLTIAADEPDRFVIIDGSLNEEDQEALIFENIRPLIPQGRC
ncbi:Thymidylate kinase [uncultured Desulfobacterium sp.]|uniref:Thymidylate kinase n=1 Tax=uncultured Desulfobacterium sp. TaxID=201089 RepID=A0A445MW62_9BACT|nr:Thymidylate kinase [uncultured Desulfobacterium sp.]